MLPHLNQRMLPYFRRRQLSGGTIRASGASVGTLRLRVADTTLALLEKAGWKGSLTAQNEEMRHLTFTRGGQELTAYISIAPKLGNRTSIQYHIVQ